MAAVRREVEALVLHGSCKPQPYSSAPLLGTHPSSPDLLRRRRALQGTAGPTKLAAERTLARLFGLERSLEPALAWVPSGGPLARTILQEVYLRRLSKMPVEEEDDGLL